ncbi:MAG: hypothetical protein HRT88_04155 [Lentisphaeraceae bacterium]|nr:hypothetical protein [Lentisphaeraceae bacterium]
MKKQRVGHGVQRPIILKDAGSQSSLHIIKEKSLPQLFLQTQQGNRRALNIYERVLQWESFFELKDQKKISQISASQQNEICPDASVFGEGDAGEFFVVIISLKQGSESYSPMKKICQLIYIGSELAKVRNHLR